MRLFVAYRVPPDVAEELKEVYDALQGLMSNLKVRWVPNEQLHVTLLFLGDVEEQSIPIVKVEVERAASRQASFRVRVGGLGSFRTGRGPGGPALAVWIGLAGLNGTGEILAERLQTGIGSSLSLDKPMRFVPHVTLARVKRLKRDQLRAVQRAIAETPTIKASWTVDHIELIKSTPQKQGHVYETVFALPLIKEQGQ